jgi:solute carrier family 40 (iron-regulated transporter), member 1
MISYLLSQGYSETFLSAMRGLSVITGLLATVTYKPLVDKIGVVRTGLWVSSPVLIV